MKTHTTRFALHRLAWLILSLSVLQLFSPSVRAAAVAEGAERAASPFTQEAFVSLLNRELAMHFNLEGELQLELLRVWTAPAVSAGDWQVVVTEFPATAASAMLVRCRLLADNVAAGEMTITLRAALWRDAWVTRQPVTTGSTFDPAVLESRRVDLFRDRDALPTSVGDQTFVFTRGVNTARVITWRDIARRPLVRKGDMVEVSAAEGNLSITMKAIALQSGAQGEAVILRNIESRKDFTAFVVDENHVEVRF